MMIPTVAAVPIRAPASVIVKTMRRLMSAPLQSHGGWRAEAAKPSRLPRATSRITVASAAERTVANASASTTPTRSPSRAITATCTEPAKPATTQRTAAPALPLNLGRRRRDGLVALEEAERVPLRVLAAREPADTRDRLLVVCLAA